MEERQSLRKIIHVDMDCFYAAVEERERPELRGKPLIVGGDPHGRGVVATCNYPARKFGIRSAMPAAKAYSLCPQAIFVRPRFQLYKKESAFIRDIFLQFTPMIEPLSLDEAYLDVTGSELFHGSASKIAQEIRRLIQEERGLTASAGVGPNKFIAKVASEFRKPDGLTVVPPAQVYAFVSRLPIESVPGIGKVTATKVKARGFESCAQLQSLTEAEMIRIFGSWGAKLYRYVRGEDDRPVKSRSVRKSISCENTFSKDLKTRQEIEEATDKLFRELLTRLDRAKDAQFKSIFVKVKFFDFERTTLERADYKLPDLAAYKELMIEAWQRKAEPVRLLGLGVRLQTSKEEKNQLKLF